MKKRKISFVGKLVPSKVEGAAARIVSAAVLIAVLLGLTGCGDQMAKINEQQATLQMMVKANSLQIEEMTARLEKNQKELNTLVESVQNNVSAVAADVSRVGRDVAAVADAQVNLQKTVQTNSKQVAERINTLGQSQQELSAGLGQAISDVQSETRKVATDLTSVAADVTAVSSEQARLFETVQQNNQDLTNKVAALEKSEQERQNTIGGMEENINALAANISGLGQDVLRLQELLQSNIRELVSIAEVAGQKRAEFQDSIRANLQTLDESFLSLQSSQSDLQSRIEQIQSNAPDLSNMPAAIDQLRNQLELYGQKQVEFQESIRSNLQMLDDSFASLKTNQDELQSRIEQMQSNAPDMSDIPAAIDQLRNQIEELSRNQMSADDIGMIEYEASAETGNIE